MEIKLQFFSHLREIAGDAERTLELPEQATVGDALTQLYAEYPALGKWDRTILVGAGVDFVGRDHVLQPNDQLAIMPPVQGG
jgi:molybdopterin synthase sulfur carrier subunit